MIEHMSKDLGIALVSLILGVPYIYICMYIYTSWVHDRAHVQGSGDRLGESYLRCTLYIYMYVYIYILGS